MGNEVDGGPSRTKRLGICGGLLFAVLLGGCQASPGGREWGRCLRPSVYQVKRAALNAVTDPHTWIPAAGAVMFAAVGDWDHDVSDWARKETPIFGSKADAKDGGELTRDIALFGGLGTALATPSGCFNQRWGFNKAKGLTVEAAAALAPQGIALWLKNTTDRRRPNGKDTLSFPSTISSEAAAWAAMGRRNVRTLPIRRAYRTAMDVGFTSAAALTAWSRVENGAHYPSDVLAGLALGNVTSVFIHDTFLGPSWRDLQFGVAPGQDGVQMTLSYTINQ